ncbi:bifunctional alpha/beta hydrolase/OsmC family protein [Pseudoalteromonas sp. APC 3358]|uniref:Bifunctional alpha/beta hydrolase/OsmC family protein n=1 Tax=Brumicola blandensis TaxID=3075611 RepID=A0AAW8QX17_9ALTE|nr:MULTISPECIES: bifunctional alpha/beta hydrolase/OsmC family protein [Alteromonadales]MDN3385174.1 bifunctional alpha/beta hydrolase/OsmC family protein [Pseudoalteromonas sp. APC 3358]MDT0581547.1 bifunctional alpha/beta hydrolase/OsmC family protein [Alteromonas sp. W409]
MRQKVEFTSNGNTLSGLLETPETNVRFYALFAHCFTCGKDVAAASRISRALTAKGIAVLRFDFTGLGNSDGDFANTNFSSNIQDLVAAADFLRDNFDAPKLLVGHSLGGAAVLGVASKVAESAAVVTIGSPLNAAHVAHNFAAQIDDIQTSGRAEVNLGGRVFTIQKQFLEDINTHDTGHIRKLNKALLVMHSPVDDVVNIKEAEKIYQAALHPKSFVSLDNADHLLKNKNDSEYVAEVIAAWATRYVSIDRNTDLANINKHEVSQGNVLVEEKDHKFAQHVSTASHYWLADEPVKVGGSNSGPDPYEHLLAGLGACTSMTLRMYAQRKKLPITHIKVELSHTRNYQDDCNNCEQLNGLEAIVRNITYTGNLDEQQQKRFLEIADKCPVHKTLHNNVAVVSKLVS